MLSSGRQIRLIFTLYSLELRVHNFQVATNDTKILYDIEYGAPINEYHWWLFPNYYVQILSKFQSLINFTLIIKGSINNFKLLFTHCSIFSHIVLHLGRVVFTVTAE